MYWFILLAAVLLLTGFGLFLSEKVIYPKVKSISPIKAAASSDIPIFFIHGKDDRYIPAQMSIALYNAKKNRRKLYLAPNSRHAESILMNKEEYDRLVGEFLEEK